MTWIDASGYLASLLVLLTFCMRTMISLRIVAICSNVAFVIYGMQAAIYPVLVLHLVLAPLNITHLVRVLRVVRRAKAAANKDLSPAWLQPFMRLQRIGAGEFVFRKGDYAERLYLISRGEVELPEIQVFLKAGDIFGEIGLFSLDRRRTQSARAASAVELLWINAEELKRLCERNPGLSLYFLRLVATRHAANALMAGSADTSTRFRDRTAGAASLTEAEETRAGDQTRMWRSGAKADGWAPREATSPARDAVAADRPAPSSALTARAWPQ